MIHYNATFLNQFADQIHIDDKVLVLYYRKN